MRTLRSFTVIVCLTQTDVQAGAIKVWPEAATYDDVDKIGAGKYSGKEMILAGKIGTTWVANAIMVWAHMPAKEPSSQYLVFDVELPQGQGFTQSQSKNKLSQEKQGFIASEEKEIVESLRRMHSIPELIKEDADECDVMCVVESPLTQLPPGSYCAVCGVRVDSTGAVFRDTKHKNIHFRAGRVQGSTRGYGWGKCRKDLPPLPKQKEDKEDVGGAEPKGEGGQGDEEGVVDKELGAEQQKNGEGAEKPAAREWVGEGEQSEEGEQEEEDEKDEEVEEQDEEGDEAVKGAEYMDQGETMEPGNKKEDKENEEQEDNKENEEEKNADEEEEGDKRQTEAVRGGDDAEPETKGEQGTVIELDTADAEDVPADHKAIWDALKQQRTTDHALVKKYFAKDDQAKGEEIVNSIREEIRLQLASALRLGDHLLKASKLMNRQAFTDFVTDLGRQPRQVAHILKFARLRDRRWRVQMAHAHASPRKYRGTYWAGWVT